MFERTAFAALVACIGSLLTAAAASAQTVSARTKADPADWILWRAAPIAFPDSIRPQVPELLQGEPPIDFGSRGSELTLVMPERLGDDDDAALDWAKRFILVKAGQARVATAAHVGNDDLQNHLLLLGTLESNPFAGRVLGEGARDFLKGITPGGYRIATAAHPTRPDRRVVVALGADLRGAYSAGAVLCHAIHPDAPGVSDLKNWPVKIPSGCYWLPFDAQAAPPVEGWQRTAPPNPPPPIPRVPFAVRVWGSPMPDLPSYQRLLRALKATGMNTIVVQSGGWVDLPNAPEVFRAALDMAWQEGIYTCLYVGNEEAAHKSAPLTEHHRAVILATQDHPGLLAFHLYNQLGTHDSAEQYQDLERQVRWIGSLGKPTSIEIVWGHNSIAIPEDKQRLMRDVKSWGLSVIGTDYAPIGGWSDKPDLPRWEAKLLALRPFEEKTEVLLQAHVPFVGATVPSAAQVRNQFWWALAGGARGYFVEVGYLFTHLNMRGLLSWDFRPLPDGRFEAVQEIAAHSRAMSEFICEANLLTAEEVAATGIRLADESRRLHLRIRTKSDGTAFALIINEDLAHAAAARITVRAGERYRASDVLAGKNRGTLDADRKMLVNVPAAGAVCLKLERAAKSGE